MEFKQVVDKLEKQMEERLKTITEAWAVEDYNELRDIAERLNRESFALRSVIADFKPIIPKKTMLTFGSVIDKAVTAKDLN